MDITSLLLSALGGGAGGNLLGMIFKNRNMGPMWNTLLGVIGGVLGGQMGGGVGGDLGGGALGGALLTLIGSFLKKKPASGG